MTGRKLYIQLIKDCIPADTHEKEYGQLLTTIHHNCLLNGQVDDFFCLLEKADSQKKKLTIDMPNNIVYNEFDIDNITLV